MVRVSPAARKSKVLSGALNVVAIDPLVLIVLSVLTEVVSADASTAKFGPLGSVAPPDQAIEARLALTVLTFKWVKVSTPVGAVSKWVLPVVLMKLHFFALTGSYPAGGSGPGFSYVLLSSYEKRLDELRGTLFRQTMFTEFEKIIHAIEESGNALTLEVFKSEYHKLLETYFAENFVLDPELNLECLRIPHFYHAFYVYKYATGISAAVALSQRVLSGESESVDAYLNFLRSGGSRFPLETLKAAGVDMATPAPIESTLRLFEQRLAELEELLL